MTPVDVVVAVPAHDEAATIGACLDSVLAAAAEARRAKVVDRARIAVAAHRCADDTIDRARTHLTATSRVLEPSRSGVGPISRVLEPSRSGVGPTSRVLEPSRSGVGPTSRVLGLSGIESLIREERAELPVGAVRSRLIHDAVAVPPTLPPDCWILSTDADSIVPVDWVIGLLAAARAADADVVLGLADLDHWAVDEATRQAYDDIVDAGIRGDQHEHAYAANLAVRWSTFMAVGGFPAVAHGEEHALVLAARAHGDRVVSPLAPRVITSARMPGRAAAGLGALLARLAGGGSGVQVGAGSGWDVPAAVRR